MARGRARAQAPPRARHAGRQIRLPIPAAALRLAAMTFQRAAPHNAPGVCCFGAPSKAPDTHIDESKERARYLHSSDDGSDTLAARAQGGVHKTRDDSQEAPQQCTSWLVLVGFWRIGIQRTAGGVSPHTHGRRLNSDTKERMLFGRRRRRRRHTCRNTANMA